MKYVFPAVIEYDKDEDVYLVEFPDTIGYFGCHTDGYSLYEALEYAEDALNLMLLDTEERGKPIPTPSDIRNIKAPEGAIVTLIRADTEAYAKMLAENESKKSDSSDVESEEELEPVAKIA